MKKVYEANCYLCIPNQNLDQFQSKLMELIKEVQNEGLEVEIQYQHSSTGVSALILGYRMVENDN